VGWVDDLHGQVVALDSAPLIYYIEEHPTYLPAIEPFFDALADGLLTAVTSTVTLAEVLTQPLRLGDAQLAATYRELLRSSTGLTLMPVTSTIAEEGARMRAAGEFRTPDAIQLATAVALGAKAFLTDDFRLTTPDLRVLVVDRL
jgi:predicted nucleic acid-binding protein